MFHSLSPAPNDGDSGMNRFTVLAITFLASANFVLAQGNAAQPVQQVPQAGQSQLLQYLNRWEQEMLKIQTLVANIKLIEKDKTFETTTASLGLAKYMKVGQGTSTVNLASLELRKEGKVELDKKFLCTGNFLYQVLFEAKEIRAFEMPKPKQGQVADDSFMSLLFGMKAEEAMKRYDLRVAMEDQWYIYMDIIPRFPADKADFQRARVVFNRATFMPRQLWFEQPNGSEVTWDLPKIDTNIRLERSEFDAPRAPQGWKMVQEPLAQQGQPRVVRPKP
jgi:TIGR03009 family protein